LRLANIILAKKRLHGVEKKRDEKNLNHAVMSRIRQAQPNRLLPGTKTMTDMNDEFVFMPLVGKKSIFTTEITDKILLTTISYLCGLCALCG
jgi:hypothetical protein